MIKLTIPLPPVTKKNSQRIVRNNRTGRYFLKPSIKFEQYQKEAGYFLGVRKVEKYPVNIKCVFYMPTRRRVDLTNLLEAIDDILVHYGIIEDDDSLHLAGHDGSRVLYDNENPRTEIYITPIEKTAENFSRWLVEQIFFKNIDDDLFIELACRKLADLGLIEKTADEWIYKEDNLLPVGLRVNKRSKRH